MSGTLLALALLHSTVAQTGYFTICAPIPGNTTGCMWVWTCPCPDPVTGFQAPCDYNPGEVVLCAGNQFSCENAGPPHMMTFDCQKLGDPCEAPGDRCSKGIYELSFAGFTVDPISYMPAGPMSPIQASCANTSENGKCRKQQYCNPKVTCCQSVGDPLSLNSDLTFESVEDVRVATTLGPLTFERYFVKSPYAYSWRKVERLVPHPFPTGSSADMMYWTHNWNSAVALESGGVTLLDPAGMVSVFPGCPSLPCYLSPSLDDSPMPSDMLYVEAGKVTLLRPGAGRFIYDQLIPDAGTTAYRLGRWEDLQYAATEESPRVRAQLTYSDDVLTAIEAADGTGLVLEWDAGVLLSVGVAKGGQTEIACRYELASTPGSEAFQLTARYGSTGDAGTRQHGLAFVGDAGQTEWYSMENGILISRHPGLATPGEFGQGDVELWRRGTTPDAGVKNWTEYIPYTGQTYRVGRSQTFVMEGSPDRVSPRLLSSSAGCDGLECTGTITRSFTYEASEGRLQTASNGRGAFTVNTYSNGPLLPSGVQRSELAATALGATDSAGSGALESKTYSYAYGSEGQTPRGWEPFVAVESRPSTLGAGQAQTITRRDASTNRVTAELRTGWTREFDPNSRTWATVPRVVATFYFTHRKCTDDAADALARTVEIHGPCVVGSTSALDCPTGTAFPVHQLGYYPATAPALKANRLEWERDWVSVTDPDDCTGTSLTTTFAAYDLRGNPTSTFDANGVETTFVWLEGRLASKTTAGNTTTYGWDNGKLTAVGHPEGNFDVFCYRQAPLGSACSTNLPPTRQLQWQVKAPNADGTGYTEGLAYFYLADGRLTREEAWDGIRNEKRRQRTFDENARGDNVRTSWGSTTSGPFELHRYDPDGELTGLNAASPNNSCGQQAHAGGSGSTTCANLKRDRMGRLASMDVAGATTGSTGRTCLGYDAQGNVASVKLGCPSNSTSYPGPDCADCTQPASSYTTDDFGNVVAMTLPHLGTDASGGTIEIAYDALGNPVYRQTPTMRSASGYHAMTYDGLGRLLSVTNHTSTGPAEALYSLAYDASATLDSSCPQPVRTLGRLLRRTDTFGDTWYQYSPEGRVLGEVRVRLGQGCGSALPRDVPHTFYSFTPNGNLASIQYPYGRTVQYSYASAGGVTTDRVGAISVTRWDGSAWQAWEAVSAVSWEPFAQLRGYQLNGDTTLAVENLLRETSPSATSNGYCPIRQPANNDLSGLVQVTQVSTGALVLGSGTGDVFQRYFQFTGLKLQKEGSCWSTYSPAKPVSYFTPSYFAGDQAVVGVGSYDTRGNRTSMRPWATSVYTDTYAYSDAGVTDRLVVAQKHSGMWPVSYAYDDDGRTTGIRWPNDSSGQPAAEEVWTPASLTAQGSGGLDSVYKSVSVSGGVYSYYYDAQNRRRLKEYPTGVQDEYFYGMGDELLVDRGNASLSAPGWLTTDEYVWLDGRPLLVFRGRLDVTTDARAADTTTACGRNGEAEACGPYFIVTDRLPRPIALLDSTGKHARTLQWDTFGGLNRTEVRGAKTAHPYGANLNTSIFSMSAPASPMVLKYRYFFDGVDTEGTAAAPVDKAELQQKFVTLATVGGYHRGRVASTWIEADGGYVSVSFRSGPRNCPPEGCLADGGLPDGGNWPYAGVELSAYELAERQQGAKAFDIPLRFPGQYFDSETGKHENWNRYYDPTTGRYLSPEPMLQDPNFVMAQAHQGLQTPSYAYALNNPVRHTDPTGLFVPAPLVIPAWAWIAGGGLAGFGIGFGASQALPGSGTRINSGASPQAGRRFWKDAKPRVAGTTCSSQPLDEKQEECKRQANNAGTRAIMRGEDDQSANLLRAIEYCQCMGATNSYDCESALWAIGWLNYL